MCETIKTHNSVNKVDLSIQLGSNYGYVVEKEFVNDTPYISLPTVGENQLAHCWHNIQDNVSATVNNIRTANLNCSGVPRTSNYRDIVRAKNRTLNKLAKKARRK